jgi:cysteine-rich repeat protein
VYGTVCVPTSGSSEGSEASSSPGEGDETSTSGDSTGLLLETGSSSGESAVETTAGETGETGDTAEPSTGTTSAPAPACGDGAVDDGEECDDANLESGDGCDANCSFERWEHAGVAANVPVADLHKWEPCWSDTYEAGDLVSSLLDACTGDHVLLACRPLGSDTLTLAAHAPRDDVFFEPQVNYDANERHNANAVGWYYSPYYGVIGFAPMGNKANCALDGQSEQMCWGVGGNMPLAFVAGRRCGSEEIISGIEGQGWERLAFQAQD